MAATVIVGIEPKTVAVNPMMRPTVVLPMQVTTMGGVPAAKAVTTSEVAAFQANGPVTSTPERARSKDPLMGTDEKEMVWTG